ncbi:MAG: type II toxin-antitoxin system YhaV family toxin [Rivularia sp. (in: cyanobacteria)]
MSDSQSLKINGWNIFFHPLFVDQFEEVLTQVELLRQKYPQNYREKKVTKRLAVILNLVLEVIPQDPTRNEYRQGVTLGEEYKHWFRAKFFQQYRLFFRYQQASKTIIFAWVNDEDTKRAYDSKTDAYRVFRKMLDNEHPPNDWDTLLEEAKAASNRLEKMNQFLDGSEI